MGFLSSLGKGFIRSAVNQVGRDYGRTISNSVFKDAHSLPVRHVGSYTDASNDTIHISSELPVETGIPYYSNLGYTIYNHKAESVFSTYSCLEYVCLVLLGIMAFVPYLGLISWIWFFFKGISIFFKKCDYPHVCASGTEYSVEQIPDRRFSCGYREESIRSFYVIHFEPSKKDKYNARLKQVVFGFLHLIFPLIVIGIVGGTALLFDKGESASVPTANDSILVLERTDEVTIYEGKTPLRKETKTFKDIRLLFMEDQLILECPYSAKSPSLTISFSQEIYNKKKKKMSQEHIYNFNYKSKTDSIYSYYLKYSDLPSQCSDFIESIEIKYSKKAQYIDLDHSDTFWGSTVRSDKPWNIMVNQIRTKHE